MKNIISQLLTKKVDSVYIPVTKDGNIVIRVSGHLPKVKNLLKKHLTKNCKYVSLIFVRSLIAAQLRKSGTTLADLVRLIDSDNPEEKMQGEKNLNNLVVRIGKDAQKGMNYIIIDGKNNAEMNVAVKELTRKHKTTVFIPLEYK
jgi:hypothetical protein